MHLQCAILIIIFQAACGESNLIRDNQLLESINEKFFKKHLILKTLVSGSAANVEQNLEARQKYIGAEDGHRIKKRHTEEGDHRRFVPLSSGRPLLPLSQSRKKHEIESHIGVEHKTYGGGLTQISERRKLGIPVFSGNGRKFAPLNGGEVRDDRVAKLKELLNLRTRYFLPNDENEEMEEADEDEDGTGETYETSETEEDDFLHTINCKSTKIGGSKCREVMRSNKKESNYKRTGSEELKRKEYDELCPENGFFPDLKSCKNFYQCDSSRRIVKYKCKNSFIFSSLVNDCVPGSNKDCKNFYCKRKRNLSVPFVRGARIYANCRKNSAKSVHICPKGSVFVEAIQKCNFVRSNIDKFTNKPPINSKETVKAFDKISTPAPNFFTQKYPPINLVSETKPPYSESTLNSEFMKSTFAPNAFLSTLEDNLDMKESINNGADIDLITQKTLSDINESFQSTGTEPIKNGITSKKPIIIGGKGQGVNNENILDVAKEFSPEFSVSPDGITLLPNNNFDKSENINILVNSDRVTPFSTIVAPDLAKTNLPEKNILNPEGTIAEYPNNIADDLGRSFTLGTTKSLPVDTSIHYPTLPSTLPVPELELEQNAYISNDAKKFHINSKLIDNANLKYNSTPATEIDSSDKVISLGPSIGVETGSYSKNHGLMQDSVTNGTKGQNSENNNTENFPTQPNLESTLSIFTKWLNSIKFPQLESTTVSSVLPSTFDESYSKMVEEPRETATYQLGDPNGPTQAPGYQVDKSAEPLMQDNHNGSTVAFTEGDSKVPFSINFTDLDHSVTSMDITATDYQPTSAIAPKTQLPMSSTTENSQGTFGSLDAVLTTKATTPSYFSTDAYSVNKNSTNIERLPSSEGTKEPVINGMNNNTSGVSETQKDLRNASVSTEGTFGTQTNVKNVSLNSFNRSTNVLDDRGNTSPLSKIFYTLLPNLSPTNQPSEIIYASPNKDPANQVTEPLSQNKNFTKDYSTTVENVSSSTFPMKNVSTDISESVNSSNFLHSTVSVNYGFNSRNRTVPEVATPSENSKSISSYTPPILKVTVPISNDSSGTGLGPKSGIRFDNRTLVNINNSSERPANPLRNVTAPTYATVSTDSESHTQTKKSISTTTGVLTFGGEILLDGKTENKTNGCAMNNSSNSSEMPRESIHSNGSSYNISYNASNIVPSNNETVGNAFGSGNLSEIVKNSTSTKFPSSHFPSTSATFTTTPISIMDTTKNHTESRKLYNSSEKDPNLPVAQKPSQNDTFNYHQQSIVPSSTSKPLVMNANYNNQSVGLSKLMPTANSNASIESGTSKEKSAIKGVPTLPDVPIHGANLLVNDSIFQSIDKNGSLKNSSSSEQRTIPLTSPMPSNVTGMNNPNPSIGSDVGRSSAHQPKNLTNNLHSTTAGVHANQTNAADSPKVINGKEGVKENIRNIATIIPFNQGSQPSTPKGSTGDNNSTFVVNNFTSTDPSVNQNITSNPLTTNKERTLSPISQLNANNSTTFSTLVDQSGNNSTPVVNQEVGNQISSFSSKNYTSSVGPLVNTNASHGVKFTSSYENSTTLPKTIQTTEKLFTDSSKVHEETTLSVPTTQGITNNHTETPSVTMNSTVLPSPGRTTQPYLVEVGTNSTTETPVPTVGYPKTNNTDSPTTENPSKITEGSNCTLTASNVTTNASTENINHATLPKITGNSTVSNTVDNIQSTTPLIPCTEGIHAVNSSTTITPTSTNNSTAPLTPASTPAVMSTPPFAKMNANSTDSNTAGNIQSTTPLIPCTEGIQAKNSATSSPPILTANSTVTLIQESSPAVHSTEPPIGDSPTIVNSSGYNPNMNSITAGNRSTLSPKPETIQPSVTKILQNSNITKSSESIIELFSASNSLSDISPVSKITTFRPVNSTDISSTRPNRNSTTEGFVIATSSTMSPIVSHGANNSTNLPFSYAGRNFTTDAVRQPIIHPTVTTPIGSSTSKPNPTVSYNSENSTALPSTGLNRNSTSDTARIPVKSSTIGLLQNTNPTVMSVTEATSTLSNGTQQSAGFSSTIPSISTSTVIPFHGSSQSYSTPPYSTAYSTTGSTVIQVVSHHPKINSTSSKSQEIPRINLPITPSVISTTDNPLADHRNITTLSMDTMNMNFTSGLLINNTSADDRSSQTMTSPLGSSHVQEIIPSISTLAPMSETTTKPSFVHVSTNPATNLPKFTNNPASIGTQNLEAGSTSPATVSSSDSTSSVKTSSKSGIEQSTLDSERHSNDEVVLNSTSSTSEASHAVTKLSQQTHHATSNPGIISTEITKNATVSLQNNTTNVPLQVLSSPSSSYTTLQPSIVPSASNTSTFLAYTTPIYSDTHSTIASVIQNSTNTPSSSLIKNQSDSAAKDVVSTSQTESQYLNTSVDETSTKMSSSVANIITNNSNIAVTTLPSVVSVTDAGSQPTMPSVGDNTNSTPYTTLKSSTVLDATGNTLPLIVATEATPVSPISSKPATNPTTEKISRSTLEISTVAPSPPLVNAGSTSESIVATNSKGSTPLISTSYTKVESSTVLDATGNTSPLSIATEATTVLPISSEHSTIGNIVPSSGKPSTNSATEKLSRTTREITTFAPSPLDARSTFESMDATTNKGSTPLLSASTSQSMDATTPKGSTPLLSASTSESMDATTPKGSTPLLSASTSESMDATTPKGSTPLLSASTSESMDATTPKRSTPLLSASTSESMDATTPKGSTPLLSVSTSESQDASITEGFTPIPATPQLSSPSTANVQPNSPYRPEISTFQATITTSTFNIEPSLSNDLIETTTQAEAPTTSSATTPDVANQLLNILLGNLSGFFVG